MSSKRRWEDDPDIRRDSAGALGNLFGWHHRRIVQAEGCRETTRAGLSGHDAARVWFASKQAL